MAIKIDVFLFNQKLQMLPHTSQLRLFSINLLFASHADMKEWCRLIKRESNRDGFCVKCSTRLCGRHFEDRCKYRPPGGSLTRLIKGARPVLHPRNDFSVPSRKPPKDRSSGIAETMEIDAGVEYIESENLPCPSTQYPNDVSIDM